VTLEDIISIKGESLTAAKQDVTHDTDNAALDNKASRRTLNTPRLQKSAGKKKVMFLSEWPQNKADLVTNLTFKRLAEVCMYSHMTQCVAIHRHGKLQMLLGLFSHCVLL